MREILFRGKREDNGEWVFGFLCQMWGAWHIMDENDENMAFPIDPETVGQHISVIDKYGNRIFEGDIVQYEDEELAEIVWDEQTARFEMVGDGVIYDFDNFYGRELEVVGNIHDNPELLKEENDDE